MLNLHFQPFPDLATDRTILRAMRAEDAPALFALRSDPKVMEHLGKPRATTLEDSERLIAAIARDMEDANGITWAITLKGADMLIGTIGFYRLKKEHYRGEVGYMLAPGLWRRGIMSEALDAVVRYGFDTVGFHSIEAVTAPENTASNTLLERNGFVQEGLFKENYFFEGRFYDSAVWSKLGSASRP